MLRTLSTSLAILAIAFAASAPGQQPAIQNDTVWLDTAGQEIRAQGGSILKVGDTWYLYGFDGTIEPSGKPGVRKGHVYSSKDLAHWKYERELFDKECPSRLDVVYNTKTKKYVMIARFKIMNHYPLPDDKGVMVQTSDTPTGPFQPQPNMKLPDSVGGGDQSVFVDDDEKAYLVYVPWRNVQATGKAEVNTHLCITQLSDDYMSAERKIVEFSNVHMEAPAVFKRNGVYHLMASGVVGWWSSATHWSMAQKLEGPWPPFKDIMSTQPNPDLKDKHGIGKSYDSQHDFVLPVKGTRDTFYMYCGDRYSQFTKEGIGKNVWLPLKFEGNTPKLDWHKTWYIHATQGTWSAQNSQ